MGNKALYNTGGDIQQGSDALCCNVVLSGKLHSHLAGNQNCNGVVAHGNVHKAGQDTNAHLCAFSAVDKLLKFCDQPVKAAKLLCKVGHAADNQGLNSDAEHAGDALRTGGGETGKIPCASGESDYTAQDGAQEQHQNDIHTQQCGNKHGNVRNDFNDAVFINLSDLTRRS